MRRERIIARILLLFTVANVALAAPAVVRQRHLDVAEAARKRGSQTTVPSDPTPLFDSTDDVESLSSWLPESQAESNSAHLVSNTGSQDRPNSEHLVSVVTSDTGSQVGTNSKHLVSDTESQVGPNPEHPNSDRESLSGGLAHDSLPESNGVITSDLTQGLKKVSIWGAIAALSAGVAYKILKKTGLSRIADRMRARPRMVLPDNPQPRKNSVSWGLGKI